MASEKLIVRNEDGVGWMIFNNPEKLNAISLEMWEAALEAMADFAADASVRVMVLTGAGGKAFVAGTDIAQFLSFQGGEDGLRYERDVGEFVGRVARVAKPVIAQIEGFAVGGGFGIAAACDLRIATPDARFGAPIARTLGNCLSIHAYARYLELLGPSRLKELIFTARLMTADEARSAGFVHEIVDAERIAARVRELAEQVASHAPITLMVTKEAIRRIHESRALPDGADLIAKTYGSADFREGVRAFVEKRPPRWTGK